MRAASAADASLLAGFCAAAYATELFAPPQLLEWPDPAGRHHAWLAFEPDGTPCGALVMWDGDAVRRLRIMRYRATDLPLRVAIGVAARLGLTNPLPAPGEVFGFWASRMVAVRQGDSRILRALLDAALTSAATAGQSAVQINLHGGDPLLRRLPPYPRSTYWTTLYGCPRDGSPVPAHFLSERFHADLARV